jgi:hypothetical protein
MHKKRKEEFNNFLLNKNNRNIIMVKLILLLN